MHPVKRGDLAILHTTSETARLSLQLAVVTSVSRDGEAKAVRRIGHRGDTYSTASVRISQLLPHAVLIVSARHLKVAAATAAILAQRADPDTGEVPAYTSPVDLLRDLHPWTTGPDDGLARLRSAAHLEVQDNPDQRCETCGVTTYGDGAIVTAEDGCPAARCTPACPINVNFTTDYPVGLNVTITAGFAAGAAGRIERVCDAYPPDHDGTHHYAGRAYALTLPYWGRRTFSESIVQPSDPNLVDQYAVLREIPAS